MRPVLWVVTAFTIVFTFLSFYVIFTDGFDVTSVFSLFVVGCLVFGVLGALRQPPR